MSRKQLAVTALVALVALVLVASSSPQRIGERNLHQIYGGQTPLSQWCQYQNTTCPDPNYADTCQFSSITNRCEKCELSVASWVSCEFIGDAAYGCVGNSGAGLPWCGVRKYDNPIKGSCFGLFCNNSTGGLTCGMQIPTTWGVPCP